MELPNYNSLSCCEVEILNSIRVNIAFEKLRRKQEKSHISHSPIELKVNFNILGKKCENKCEWA